MTERNPEMTHRTVGEIKVLVMQIAASAISHFNEYPEVRPETQTVKSEAWTALESAITELVASNDALEAANRELREATATLREKLMHKSDDLAEIISGMRHRTIPYPTAVLQSHLDDFDRIIKRSEASK